MSNRSPNIHLTFSESAAGGLKQYLAKLGRRERVIPFAEDLGVGPIDPADPAVRAEWIAHALGYEVDSEIVRNVRAFWTATTSQDATVIAWMSQRSVRELTGFLELIWRRRGLPTMVVDVTDFTITDPGDLTKPIAPCSFSTIRPEWMSETRLIDQARVVSDLDAARYRATWGKLKVENAPLRVLDDTGLVSVKLSHFDAALASLATDEWRQCVAILVTVLGSQQEHGFDQIGDLFLWSRLLTLVDDGVLEFRDEATEMTDSWVRRVQAKV